MLQDTSYEINERRFHFGVDIRSGKDLPLTLEFWAAYLARDLLQFGVFLRAAGIMLQIPGGGRYDFVHYGQIDDDPGGRICLTRQETVFNVLAECLQRLGAEVLIEQVPGYERYERKALSEEWQHYLDRQATIDLGLLNVIAECLDRLIVEPGMKEIDSVGDVRQDRNGPTWWQKFWVMIPRADEP